MYNQKTYEYINSKDIREYLKNLDYQFTPVQCAFLVWQSKRHTLKQKHEAWNGIIEMLPDCEVKAGFNCKGWDSLHVMLREYMAFEQKYVALFCTDESNVLYEYEFLTQQILAVPGCSRYEYDWNSGDRHFCSLAACYQLAVEDAAEENCCCFRITKRFMDDAPLSVSSYEPYITVEYDLFGEILGLSISNSFSLNEREKELWYYSFDGMWFDIPIPFEKGDIVCESVNGYTKGVPFVLLGTDPWYRKEHSQMDIGDYSDMYACGYSYDCKQQFFNDDFMVGYLNLEYYTKPLQGPERLLYAYSQFVKKEIDGYTLLKLDRMIQAEVIAEKEFGALALYLPKDVLAKYSHNAVEEIKYNNE